MTMILSILSLFFIIRLLFLAVSIKHEKALIAKGAKQYGKPIPRCLRRFIRFIIWRVLFGYGFLTLLLMAYP